MESFKPYIAKVAAGAELTRAEAFDAFEAMLSGDVTPSQIGGFLMALRVRGEGVEEITGAVAAMRARMLKVTAPPDAIDIVGTGGDGSGSYNVSTLAAIITAACGVPVAKHGNRAASSKSGSSDALTALGVKIGLPPEGVERCLAGANVGFMMAPAHHASMRHVAAARIELGARTIFNLLGPLSNPASVKRQVIGVFSPAWAEPMARVLRNHGSDRIWICHGEGLDEITTTGPTEVVELKDGEIRAFAVTPEEAGLPRAAAADLRGGDPTHNARALREVLAGSRNAYRDIAVLNAAAGLVVAGAASHLAEGAELAARALDKGAAMETLQKLIAASNA